jgi:hypothetical protein
MRYGSNRRVLERFLRDKIAGQNDAHAARID